MSSTARKMFLQTDTSTAAERAAYRKAQREARKAQDKIDQVRIDAAHKAWVAAGMPEGV